MSAVRRYVLDANVFLEAHERYYAQDICPGFWQALVREHRKKRVYSIDRVKSELVSLKDWVKDVAPESFFKQTADKSVVDRFAEMVSWVNSQSQFLAAAKAEFANVADGWVIAYAKANGLIVVTHEEYAPDAKKKVPMPNVCIEFDVEYVSTFDMLRELKVKFGLKKHG